MSLIQCRGGGTICRKEIKIAFDGSVRVWATQTGASYFGGNAAGARYVVISCFGRSGRCKVCGHIVRCKRVNWDRGQLQTSSLP
jgi:hypothetical protein